MSKQLTMKELKASIDGLTIEVHELRFDFGSLRNSFVHLGSRFSSLQSSVDQYLKRTESWHDEQVILKARHDRLSDSLVKKGIVTKEETLL